MSRLDGFDEYKFDDDLEFQEGLKDILRSVADKPQEEQDRLIDAAKAFYYSKISNRQRPAPDRTPPNVENTANTDEERPLTFAELTALIQSGQTHLIPNNKTLPEGTTDETPSTSAQAARKKPWEAQ